ncbi:MAG: polymerase, sigma-24 subunit, subfamily [Myxococcales bacterium]|nr:polymerase, sigma-24 subunit, subfamily [Myxococcales bacterium]
MPLAWTYAKSSMLGCARSIPSHRSCKLREPFGLDAHDSGESGYAARAVGGSRWDSFVAGLHADARSRFEAVTTAPVLETHLQKAHEAWPDITVAPERFASELARRLGAEASLESLRRICATDVYLAIACAEGDGAAIRRFEQTYLREVEISATKVRATPDQVAEVKATLRRVLFVDEPNRPAATREFSGRGNLRAYVRVMATRDLIRTVNRGRKETPIPDDDILDRLAPHHDPELSILRAQYQDVVDDAMRAAVAGLDDRTRALLRYQLVDGWTVDQVGKLYGVHRATAARWIVSARAAVGDRIQTELAKRLSIHKDEVASIVRLVTSRVDVSLDRLLGPAHDETVAAPPPRASR